MRTTFLKNTKLIAVIKTSCVQSPVEWIDLECKRCRTQAGYEADLDDFEFIDSRDYDALRGEYAGRMMQAIITGMMGSLEIMKHMYDQAKKAGYERRCEKIAADAVAYADALINELKRPKDHKEMFGL